MGFRVNAEEFRSAIHNAKRKLDEVHPKCLTEFKIKMLEDICNFKFVPHNDSESLYDGTGIDVDVIFPSEYDYLAFLLKYA